MSSNLRPNNLLLSGFLVPPDTLQCRVLSDMPRGHAGGYHLGAHPDSLSPGTLRNNSDLFVGLSLHLKQIHFALGHPVSLNPVLSVCLGKAAMLMQAITRNCL